MIAMMPVALAVDLVFLGMPNKFLLGAVCMGSAIAAFAIIFRARSLAPTHENRFIIMVVKGQQVLKHSSVALLFLSGILLGNTTTPIAGSIWTMDALNKGGWCIARGMSTLSLVASSFMFDVHPVIRAYEMLLLPLQGCVIMLSQMDFVVDLLCMDHGVCEDDDYLRRWLYVFIFRDLLALFLVITLSSVSVFLAAFYGLCGNELTIPSDEHIEFVKLLSRSRHDHEHKHHHHHHHHDHDHDHDRQLNNSNNKTNKNGDDKPHRRAIGAVV